MNKEYNKCRFKFEITEECIRKGTNSGQKVQHHN